MVIQGDEKAGEELSADATTPEGGMKPAQYPFHGNFDGTYDAYDFESSTNPDSAVYQSHFYMSDRRDTEAAASSTPESGIRDAAVSTVCLHHIEEQTKDDVLDQSTEQFDGPLSLAECDVYSSVELQDEVVRKTDTQQSTVSDADTRMHDFY
jgi:hypothetical protein